MVSSSLTGLSVWQGFHNRTIWEADSLGLQISSPDTISSVWTQICITWRWYLAGIYIFIYLLYLNAILLRALFVKKQQPSWKLECMWRGAEYNSIDLSEYDTYSRGFKYSYESSLRCVS